MNKTVVILVDDKARDLPGCALIAHNLEKKFNIRCELQPLESWRSCLAALKPDYILFNHLTASHLAHFSSRLKEMGILVGVLPNEGIIYDEAGLAFNAGLYHSYAHIDQFFCWNDVHQDAVRQHMDIPPENVHVVGIPRFDYYFEPWRRVFHTPGVESAAGHPRILICTNFSLARFKDLPRDKADRHFSPWKDRVSSYKNYWDLIEVNARSRARFFDFLNALVSGTEHFIDLKPHPREDRIPYKKWLESLPPADRQRVRLVLTESIFEVLPLCDLEVSCEKCTTALESWILGKPTIELIFEKHPVFFDEETARCNRLCEAPEQLPDLIKHELKNPEQNDLKDYRVQHLAKWCAYPSGDSAFKVARTIARALGNQAEPRWHFAAQDWRRGVKLKVKNFLGLAYGSNPWKLLWGLIPGVQENYLESKFIRPADARRWKERLLKSGFLE